MPYVSYVPMCSQISNIKPFYNEIHSFMFTKLLLVVEYSNVWTIPT